MAAAVNEGIDSARARFSRYARTVAEQCPSLTAVAAAYPAAHRAWPHPSDVDPESAAARQLSLLDEFTRGTRNASDFAHGWRETRRASQANGERIQGSLEGLFDRVLMLLEDYSPDPDLVEPGDLSDTDLQAAVSEAWNAFDGGEHP
ncbi:hypothetical protein [Streptomyces sp. HUAS ZL42]|uniref:hypothetical protein n=1 Tax=Streptomyces sp. HUAS ZL42 TaxID=3231715 RepID=UPI00345EA1DB